MALESIGVVGWSRNPISLERDPRGHICASKFPGRCAIQRLPITLADTYGG